MKVKNNIQIIQYPPEYPKSVHLYVTNQCNLNCERCHYRSKDDLKKELSLYTIEVLFQEWKGYDLTSIAIGGGEPLLHPNIIEIVQSGLNLGFFMAVTTNGTVLKPIHANRVHISCDELHPTWKNEDLIQNAINYYKELGCKVGINHVVSTLENIEYIENTFKNIDNLLLIREKPISSFNKWDKIPFRQKYWIEGCIEGSYCEQGILSFHLDYDLNASICSNLKKKIKYQNLEQTWNKLKQFKCDIRDFNKPLTF